MIHGQLDTFTELHTLRIQWLRIQKVTCHLLIFLSFFLFVCLVCVCVWISVCLSVCLWLSVGLSVRQFRYLSNAFDANYSVLSMILLLLMSTQYQTCLINKAPLARCWNLSEVPASHLPQQCNVVEYVISNVSPGPLVEKCAQAMKTLDNSTETAACSMDVDTQSPVE